MARRKPIRLVVGMLAVTLIAMHRNVEAQQRSPGGSSTLLSASGGAGARALGMGGAFVAIAGDATAASWNPAGLVRLERRQISLGGDLTWIADSMPSYESTRTFATGLRILESGPAISATRRSNGPDVASITYPVRVRAWTIVPQFSYRRAVKGNFSETTARPYEYMDSTGFGESGSDEISFEGGQGMDVYSAAVGIPLTPILHVGAAINSWRGGSDGSDTRILSATFSFGSTTGPLTSGSYRTTYEGTFKGTSVDVGVLFSPFQRVRVGAVVKEGFSLTRTYGYTRQYTNWSGGISSETHTETGTIDWPRSVGIGAAIMPFERLTVSTDYSRSSWSKATYRFTSSNVQIIRGERAVIETAGVVVYPDMYDPAIPVQPYFNMPQLDSSQWRAGAEFIWRRSGALAAIPFRGGMYRNRSILPQSNGDDRVGTGVTAGTGVSWRRLDIDVAYVRESISGKTREFALTSRDGFSQSQQQSSRERSVVNRLLLTLGASF
jgi:hypothetical protein